MLVERREMVTRSLDSPESPEGRDLKHTAAALQYLLRTTAISCALRLASVCFRSRRDTIYLIRDSLDPTSYNLTWHTETRAHFSFSEQGIRVAGPTVSIMIGFFEALVSYNATGRFVYKDR